MCMHERNWPELKSLALAKMNVDRFFNSKHVGYVGNLLGNAFGQVPNDAGIDVEQIVAGHPGFSGYSSRNHNVVGAFECSAQVFRASICRDLKQRTKKEKKVKNS